MIQATLAATKAATFAVHLPARDGAGFPRPMGTGFFVSGDGIFLTAAHVVTENARSDGPLRSDIASMVLMKEMRGGLKDAEFIGGEVCRQVALETVDPVADLAILRLDLEANKEYDWLKTRVAFPFLRPSSRILDEGEAVYAFGYPLSHGGMLYSGPEVFVGTISLSPRVTSAIVSSTIELAGMITECGPPIHYILDKALNYGNSGGPILAATSGHVHAFCSRFQPVFVPQAHLRDQQGKPMPVMIPSLYGVVTNLNHPRIRTVLEARGVAYDET